MSCLRLRRLRSAFQGQRGGKEVERHSPAPAPAKNAWDNYVGQLLLVLLLLLRYARHTAIIADPCAGA